MAEVKHISIDTPDEEALEIIDNDAAVIIDDVIPESKINTILDELDPVSYTHLTLPTTPYV